MWVFLLSKLKINKDVCLGVHVVKNLYIVYKPYDSWKCCEQQKDCLMWKECAEQRTRIQGREKWDHFNDIYSDWVRIGKVRDKRESILKKGRDRVVLEIWKSGVGLVGGGIMSVKILNQLKINPVKYNTDLCSIVLVLSSWLVTLWLVN